MIDEGYIKFHCHWEKATALQKDLSELISWRNKLFQMGLIGHYHDINVGFGNISQKMEGKQFIISGTQTGHIEYIQAEHFTTVTDYNISTNEVWCKGPVKASSEFMTHAMIYDNDPLAEGVIHIHSKALWKQLINKASTTKKEVPYGTPEMANEITRLFNETEVKNQKIIVMAGHEEGILSFGTCLEEAGKIIENLIH
jgi:class II aldolase/adducin N-terminal domain-containing protein